MKVAIGNFASARAVADEYAYTSWFESYSQLIYNHCFRRTGSWTAAEELTATAFLEAWRCRASAPSDPDGVLPWLLAVTNNVLRNVRRAERRHAAFLARLPRPEPVSDPSDDVAAKLDAERQMQLLLPAMRALPQRERQVIELCIGDGLTHAQAALTLNVPVGTVKSRLSRGLTRLRAAKSTRPSNDSMR